MPSMTAVKRAFRLYSKQQGLADSAINTRWLSFLAILRRYEDSHTGKGNADERTQTDKQSGD